MAVELTAPKIRVLLWYIHTLDLAYGIDPPHGSLVEELEHDLTEELHGMDAPQSKGINAS